MTGDELQGGTKLISEVGEIETTPMEDPTSSPLQSYQSLHSNQSNEEGMKVTKIIPYVPPLKETRFYSFRIPYQRWTIGASVKFMNCCY